MDSFKHGASSRFRERAKAVVLCVCVCQTPKHGCTTSFLEVGRCRKAIVCVCDTSSNGLRHPSSKEGGAGSDAQCVCHPPSIAFRHLPPNSARFSYTTEGALFISAQLSTDAVSALRKVRVPITLRALLSGTFLQTLPHLVTPMKGHYLSPRSCPATRSAPSERFGY